MHNTANPWIGVLSTISSFCFTGLNVSARMCSQVASDPFRVVTVLSRSYVCKSTHFCLRSHWMRSHNQSCIGPSGRLTLVPRSTMRYLGRKRRDKRRPLDVFLKLVACWASLTDTLLGVVTGSSGTENLSEELALSTALARFQSRLRLKSGLTYELPCARWFECWVLYWELDWCSYSLLLRWRGRGRWTKDGPARGRGVATVIVNINYVGSAKPTVDCHARVLVLLDPLSQQSTVGLVDPTNYPVQCIYSFSSNPFPCKLPLIPHSPPLTPPALFTCFGLGTSKLADG